MPKPLFTCLASLVLSWPIVAGEPGPPAASGGGESYQFSALPDWVSGTPVAVADDGALLLPTAIYQRGELGILTPSDPWPHAWATELSANHTLVARPDFEFEALPASVDGEALGWPVAIADDGAVLVTKNGLETAGVYHHGRLETVELGERPPGDPPYRPYVRDMNVRHQIVGYWSQATYLPVPATGLGFVRDLRDDPTGGMMTFPHVYLDGINDAGVVAGSFVTSTNFGDAWYEYHGQPVLVMDGEVHPIALPGVDASTSAYFRRINNRGGVLGIYGEPPDRRFFVFDHRGLRVLDPPLMPDLPGLFFDFVDLDDRGQVLGRWSTREPTTGITLAHSFVREVDGNDRVIDCAYAWPQSIIAFVGYPEGEVATFTFSQSLGTLAHAMNSHGEILVTATALYRGQNSLGTPIGRFGQVHGVARRAATREPR